MGPGTGSLANIQQASLTDTGGAVRTFTVNSTWTGSATLYGTGGNDKLNAPTSLAGQIQVDTDLAQATIGQNLTGSLSMKNVVSVSVGGTVAGSMMTPGNVGTLSVGQTLSGSVAVGGNLGTATVGQGLSARSWLSVTSRR